MSDTRAQILAVAMRTMPILTMAWGCATRGEAGSDGEPIARVVEQSEGDAPAPEIAPRPDGEPGALAPPPAPEPTPPPGPAPLVDDDESDDLLVGPPNELADCEVRLDDANVDRTASRIPVHETRGGLVCGAPQVVRYRGSDASIRWSSSPKITCGMAASLAAFERIVQEEAERCFGRRVVKIEHMGTYNCREMAAYPGWVSEHSYGNAIDIKRFILAGGREVPVLGHYGDAGVGPDDPDSRFLQAVARRAYDEDVFSVVLTPAFDRQHRNHFHLDLARYRVDGTGRG